MAARKRGLRQPVNVRAQWQIVQAAKCGCGGSDDMCSCQNEEAPWRYGLGPKPPERTVAWLLEWPGNDNMPTRYWNPTTGWMLDPEKACWFAREADARSYKSQSRMHGVIVGTEHVFGLNLAREGERSEDRATPNNTEGES